MAAILAAAIGYGMWRVPVQVYDSLGEIVAAHGTPSVAVAFWGSMGSAGYLRPLRIAQIKALYDLAGGRHYRLVYRGFHVILLVALLLLFVWVLPVRSSTDAAAAAFALVVLTGLHTFISFVREAFPINHFLEIAVMCLAALRLAQSKGGWWADAGAGLIFAAAVLTLESGVLVWVVVVAAWLVGYRGVSGRGLALVTLLLAGYGVLRFEYLSTGVPALAERASGFFLERLEPDELQRRFGAAPLGFYLYNVAASAFSVVFSEPQAGVFITLRAWLEGQSAPRLYLAAASSIATTGLIGWAVVSRWRSGAPVGDADRLIGVGAAVLLANALLSFAYTKDEIVAVAGVFYALAAFSAARALIDRVATTRPVAVFASAAVLLVLASAWTVRSAGVHHILTRQAFRVQGDWADVPSRMRREGQWPDERSARELIERLRTDAVAMDVPNPQLMPAAYDRWFGD
jgi:hypothetical protein